MFVKLGAKTVHIAQYLICKKFLHLNMTLFNDITRAKNVIITFVATEVSG